jgi:hypothetical protein
MPLRFLIFDNDRGIIWDSLGRGCVAVVGHLPEIMLALMFLLFGIVALLEICPIEVMLPFEAHL